MSTPKALNTEAQGKRHELRECRATLGYESNESSVEANTLQQGGTLPRPKQASDDFGLGNVPHQWIPLVSADHIILSYPGWRLIRYRESALTLGFGVQRLRRSCFQSIASRSRQDV